MIEISRTQDEEVGDGTTSVIILGEEHWLSRYSYLSDNTQVLTAETVCVQPVRCCLWPSSSWSSRCIRPWSSVPTDRLWRTCWTPWRRSGTQGLYRLFDRVMAASKRWMGRKKILFLFCGREIRLMLLSSINTKLCRNDVCSVFSVFTLDLSVNDSNM